ncbi:reverse transcriptase [Tanacetum coccineum]|uniref:Reverse transcriptase n=1 Tax=Tanacetum coccineum TaxID=301880 RepID=A0ABQ5H282_9ASTR
MSLECYLRCICGEKPKEWCKWLPLAEWWYNTNYHSTLNTTPYEILYGQMPPIHIPYVPGESRVDTVDRTLTKAILDRKLKVGNAAAVFILIHWSNSSEEDATWESIEDIQAQFPHFNVLV